MSQCTRYTYTRAEFTLIILDSLRVNRECIYTYILIAADAVYIYGIVLVRRIDVSEYADRTIVRCFRRVRVSIIITI